MVNGVVQLKLLHSVRAQQRDTSLVQQLTHLSSDVIRSALGESYGMERLFRQLMKNIGSRWILNHETLLAGLVRAVYLILLLGRGHQTLGEEYTDILATRKRSPVRRRVSVDVEDMSIHTGPF